MDGHSFLKDAKGSKSAHRALFVNNCHYGHYIHDGYCSLTALIERFYICVQIQPPECRMPLSFYRKALNAAFDGSELLSKYECLKAKSDDSDLSDVTRDMFGQLMPALGSMLSILAAVSTGPHVKRADPDQLLKDWTSVCKIFSSLDQSSSKKMVLHGLRAGTVISTFCAQISSDDSGVECEIAKIQQHLSQSPEVFDYLIEAKVLTIIAESLCQPYETPTACLSIQMLTSVLELAQNTFKNTPFMTIAAELMRQKRAPYRSGCVNLKEYPLDSSFTQFESFLDTLKHLPYQQHCDFESSQQCWGWFTVWLH